MTAPAPLSRATTAASRVGTWVRSEAEPAVVVTPATSNVSLIVIGTPWKRPPRLAPAPAPRRPRALAPARASAESATIAFSRGLSRAMRSSMRVVSSTEDTCPAWIAPGRVERGGEVEIGDRGARRAGRQHARARAGHARGQARPDKRPTIETGRAHGSSWPGVGMERASARAGKRRSAASSSSTPRPGRVGTVM